ncbi:MAG TPA: M1 family metallopeptidase [Puia sp.]|nr:M1 family metallopeptidase [Puia sp.]
MARYLLLILTALHTGRPHAHAQAQRWQQQVNYSIDVTLTDSTHSLDGRIRIGYINHSPDTLSFIWIRCWPNALKNDRTALSEQLIQNGRTDFYFSDKSRKGYLNHLEFRVDSQLAIMQDHPLYIDVIKVILPAPLPPGDSTTITTPFHVQLPDNFTGSGYRGGIYEITNWYPKPAVYDNRGWHPDPFLEKGGSYNEFGDFDVHITVPANFTVAATGNPETPADSTTGTKTFHYHGSDIPDFAWFASRRFHSIHDTLQLPSGRIINLYSYYIRTNSPIARNAIPDLKNALRFFSTTLGEYPFDNASIVETRSDNNRPSPLSAASFPAIISIDSRDTAGFDPGLTIEKEIGAQWLSIAIGADGRRYPWMTDGIGQYYYDRYRYYYDRYRYYSDRYRLKKNGQPHAGYYGPDTFHRSEVNTRVVLHEDQPISTSTEEFTPDNYRLIGEFKTAIWMHDLEGSLGTPLFDSCMHNYFRKQQFHRTSPAELKAVFAVAAPGLNVDSAFALLDTTGPEPPSPYHRLLTPDIQFIPHPTHRNSLNISPAIGFNNYDHWMIGALIHNFNLPPDNWQFVAAPLYATASHQFNGLIHLNYAWYPHQAFRLIEAGINGSRFSTINGIDSNGHAIFGGFYKIAPCFRLFFRPSSIGSTQEIILEGKTYLIGEKSFSNYVLKSTDSLYYPVAGKYEFRYLNQLTFTIRDHRVLYPYSVNLQVQQAAQWYRLNLDIHYFFNYATTGGLEVRLFGAKFGYLGARNPAEDLTPFEPKLTAVRGSEDYTYDNYFVGRNDFNGLASQQIMMRDGDLKLRTDLFEDLQGRSDNWVAAVNLKSTLPPEIIPRWLPLRLFLDVGTYAQAWSDNPPTSHFLYVGGFELDFFHDVLHIYAPLLYSSDFSTQLKTVPGQNGFFQKVSFSIDFQQIPFRKWFGYTPF